MKRREIQVGISSIDKVKTYVDGALPILSAICEKIRLAENIDDNIDSDQSNRIVSTGVAVKAMVMNIVAKRRALYKLDEFYDVTDTEKLFGEGIHAHNLTDDVMARALDELYEMGPKRIMTETAMSIINKYDIPVTSIHADTTSKSLYGAYASSNDEGEAVHITRGHSKDHRPDLKQIIFGLGVTKDRIIVLGDVADGNRSDKDWNKDILKELRENMKTYGLSDFIYVADSACLTEETLETLAGNGEDKPVITFVSRLPGNYKLERELKERALSNPNDWEELGAFTDKENGAEYKVQSFEGKLYDRTYRFIVCHSTQLECRKEKIIESAIKDEKKSVSKKIEGFQKREFNCAEDADNALQVFEKDLKLKYHELVYGVEAVERPVKRGRRGRPSKNEVPQVETIYKGSIQIYNDDIRIQKCKDKASLFVLITNADEKSMNNKTVLKEYKDQSSVETSFRVLKDPYFIDELFVKTPERVEALSYVMLIAFMLLTLLERTVRENLKGEKKPAIVSGKRKTFTPTGVSIIETFENVLVMSIYDEEKDVWERHCRLKDNQKRLINLSGFDESIYIEALKKMG